MRRDTITSTIRFLEDRVTRLERRRRIYNPAGYKEVVNLQWTAQTPSNYFTIIDREPFTTSNLTIISYRLSNYTEDPFDDPVVARVFFLYVTAEATNDDIEQFCNEAYQDLANGLSPASSSGGVFYIANVSNISSFTYGTQSIVRPLGSQSDAELVICGVVRGAVTGGDLAVVPSISVVPL